MRTLCVLIIISILGSIGNKATAQGTITYDTTNKFPYTSKNKSGSIAVKGSIAIDKDWEVVSVAFWSWRDGRAQAKINLPFDATTGQWPYEDGVWKTGEMMGLTPDTEFNIVVIAKMRNTTTNEEIPIATAGVKVTSSK